MWLLAVIAGIVIFSKAVGTPGVILGMEDHSTELYTDQKGAVWTLFYDSMHSGKWHAKDAEGAYGTKNWAVSSTEGTKEQAKLAAEWWAQEHKRIR